MCGFPGEYHQLGRKLRDAEIFESILRQLRLSEK